MAYDEALADRVRSHLGDDPAVDERRMFGGIAFFCAGNMAVGIAGGELIVRLGPEGAAEALAGEHTRPFDITGRAMTGWVMVAPEALDEDGGLAGWVGRGLAFARTLPPKGG